MTIASIPTTYYSINKLRVLSQIGSVPLIRQILADAEILPVEYRDDLDWYDGRALLELNAWKRENNR